MKRIVILLLLTTMPAQAQFLGFGKKEPINFEDARAVVQALRPASKGGDFDVYLSMGADGKIRLSMTVLDNTKVHASGGDLKSTVEDLVVQLRTSSSKALNAAEAAQTLLNQGKASQ